MSAHASSAHAPSEHAPSHHEPAPGGLDPDEPHTPYWLTALGGALFLAAAVFFLATGGDDAEAPSAPAGDSPSAEREAADEPPSEE